MNTEMINQLAAYTDEDASGVLRVMEFKNIPFVPKRMFYVSEVDPYHSRGFHAHVECQQVLICIAGSVSVTLYKTADPNDQEFHSLDKGDCLFVDKMVWGEQCYRSEDSVLMVLCSHEYDTEDYIRSFDVFLAWKKDPQKIENWKKGQFDNLECGACGRHPNACVCPNTYISCSPPQTPEL